jgi:hypothetical protein
VPNLVGSRTCRQARLMHQGGDRLTEVNGWSPHRSRGLANGGDQHRAATSASPGSERASCPMMRPGMISRPEIRAYRPARSLARFSPNVTQWRKCQGSTHRATGTGWSCVFKNIDGMWDVDEIVGPSSCISSR